MSTVRFAQVVAHAGQPESYTLWVDPKKDASFQKLLNQERVMTVHQETGGTKKDYGEVGYTGGKSASLLVFPKSLRAFAGKRVIGVKYDLLQPVKAARRHENSRPPTSKPPQKPEGRRADTVPQPLRVFDPNEQDLEPRPDARKRRDATPALRETARELDQLRGQVRKAMKALAQGKAVAAYQLLEGAIRP